MAIFMIGYDLHEGEDYSKVEDAIKAYGTWWHHLDSTWLIKSNKTADEVRDNLVDHMPSDGKLLVMRYGKTVDGDGANAAWRSFNSRGNTWLRNQL